ncbi:hypothetical protein MLD38_022226 [Melastoma candidum]|uniref:Uncharacterized protein n=1 Tax=Melastoma candidum TaxID=119954 RepID=A0ACB9QJT1_9MYRT|nr:hypothetical protein MLD38_022226 [Melastoma candidum]
MGKGKSTKKFIDKKKAATFQLMPRDSEDPSFVDPSDRVFVRVDGNHYFDADSIFADAPEEDGDDVEGRTGEGAPRGLEESVRKEIIELGLPDDGYNYLIHLREIKNTGGGSSFFHNHKARLDLVPKDVKAYDASRVHVARTGEDVNDGAIYSVSSSTVNVRMQKAYDPEVAALLDDSDLSRFASDDGELEEDFVVQANCAEDEDGEVCGKLERVKMSDQNRSDSNDATEKTQGGVQEMAMSHLEGHYSDDDHDPSRVRRLVDEQFDMLERQEYGSEDDVDEYGGYFGEDDETLAEKLKHAFNGNIEEELENEDGYKAPAESAVDVVRRCIEYAEQYEKENEQEDKEVVLVEESSDGSEVWDCETIITTYSNLDNHPGKIEVPEATRKKKLATFASGVVANSPNFIALKGRGKLPVDYLPRSSKPSVEKAKGERISQKVQHKHKPHGQESKEEKKERKAAVKEERREARRTKKEMKGLYKCEAQRAQRVAATTGPSSIPLA